MRVIRPMGVASLTTRLFNTNAIHEYDDDGNEHDSRSLSYRSNPTPFPLVVSLNCIEDCVLDQEYLADVALVQHVPLSRLTDEKIEVAAAILLNSFAYLPRAAQRHFSPRLSYMTCMDFA